LDHERRLVKPRLILALGATAGLAVLGRKPAVQVERGRIITADDGARVLLTVHPAYLLRLPDPAARESERVRFLADLELAASEIGSPTH
jgi:DNA polymerase